jgi:hypothetical protein
MAEPHVVAALRDKRAELSGSIADLEKRIGQHRADLLHVDAVLRLFAPDLEPATILPKAVRRPSGWFRPGELARMVLDVLRTASTPLSIREITVQIMEPAGSTHRMVEWRNCCASWSETPSTGRPPIWWNGSRTETWSAGGCASDQAAWRLRCQ